MRLRRSLTTMVAASALVVVAGCGGAEDEAEPENGAPAATEEADEAAPEETGDAGATEDEPAEDSAEEPGGEAGITMAEVEENATPESCWASIDGTVYDLTDWIGQHPGGAERIENLCGTDATEAFTGQHGGQSGPEGQLAEFEIGTLTE